MSEEHNFASEYKPTRMERFWRWMGYRYHLAELPETDMLGWMMTKTRFTFSVADRFRLLLSGTLALEMRQATDVEVTKCVSAVSFSIKPPFGDSHE